MGSLLGIGAPRPTVGALQQLYFNAPPPPGTGGTISPAKPTVADRVQDGLGAVLTKLGMAPQHARDFSARATSFLNDVTPVGAASSAQQAGRDFRAGNYLGAAGNGLGALLSVLPDGGGTVAHSIIAPLFHGTPHLFDKFALEKIGTGEGAQAYGHGLYFAENPDVAQSYRDNLSGLSPATHYINGVETNPRTFTDAQSLGFAAIRQAALHKMTPDQILDHVLVGDGPGKWPQGLVDEARSIAGSGAYTFRPPGYLYKVSIDANPEDFLDWDKTFSQQSGNVQSAVQKLFGLERDPSDIEAEIDALNAQRMALSQDRDPVTNRIRDEQQWHDLARRVVDLHGQIAPFGTGAHAYFGARQIPAESSQALNDLGVPGIRYLDQGSRAAGQGSSNYVVFDPSLIDILDRQ